MRSSEFPKILIVGQPFNRYSGGGITLSNLFFGWPVDNIAVIADPYILRNFTTDVCRKYYQIGREEQKWQFPFSLYKQSLSSGSVTTDSINVDSTVKKKPGIRKYISEKLADPFIAWTGLIHSQSRTYISEDLKNWISAFNPDILYVQVATREGILFATSLIDYLQIPSVIHMMDDWPSVISDKGLFRNYWKKKIDREFRTLLNKTGLHLSICDTMSQEYKKRYGHEFIGFHNPIDLNLWTPKKKTLSDYQEREKSILYSGRIGRGIRDSLFDIANVVEKMRSNGYKLKMHIQSPNLNKSFLEKIKEYDCVVVNPPADYTAIPRLYANADILVIANDFTAESIRFLKYSMPTKAPEYMISGTAVLVYASADTAVSSFFLANECGYCVTERDMTKIEKAIDILLTDHEFRSGIIQNAVRVAKEKFDSVKVRADFQDLLKDFCHEHESVELIRS